MKSFKKKSYLPTISLCIGLLISVAKLNQSEGSTENINSNLTMATSVTQGNSEDYWRSKFEIIETITLNNYKYIAEGLMKRMDSFIAATPRRHSILDNFSLRLKHLTQFNKNLEPQLKALCEYDRNCLEKFEQIAERIPQKTSIFRLLQEARDSEVSVIAEYLKFKKEFSEAEEKIPNGGFLILSKSGAHMQYVAYLLFQEIQEMIESSYKLSSSSDEIYFESEFQLTGNYSDEISVSLNLTKSRLHIIRTFCATPIIASLDLSTGKLLNPDQSGLKFQYTSAGVKRLPASYFLNLIGDYAIKGQCKQKLFGSPSVELDANNKLNVSYQEFTYKSYRIDEFGMGVGSGWRTHTKMKRFSAQIY
ncbi:MAG: hypothetical protein ACXVCP_02670 [Bdellovibrio sp.]